MQTLKRLWGLTVWSHSGVAAADWRYRGIFRFVLPITDLLFVWFGVFGFTRGVESVQEAAGAEWQTWWSAGLALSAALAFVGVAIPRLWVIEMVAKIALVAHIAAYVVVSIGRVGAVPAAAGVVCILILLPIWRVGDLGFVAWQRGHEARIRR